MFGRGYGEVREKISKVSKYTMSCFNCEYYFKDIMDDDEMCQNKRVVKYDMVVTDNNICCNLWELSHRVTHAKTLFKKGKKI